MDLMRAVSRLINITRLTLNDIFKNLYLKVIELQKSSQLLELMRRWILQPIFEYLYTLRKLFSPSFRNDFLRDRNGRGLPAWVFFATTTSVAVLLGNYISAVELIEIYVPQSYLEHVFNSSIFGVELKFAGVSLMNAIGTSVTVWIVTILFGLKIKFIYCVRAFLYSFSIVYLISAFSMSIMSQIRLSDTFQVENFVIGSAGGHGVSLTSNSWEAFDGERQYLPTPPHLTHILANYGGYFIPNSFSRFDIFNLIFSFSDNSRQSMYVLQVLDARVLLGVYFLGLPVLATIMSVFIASVLGFYTDALISRYATNHLSISYYSYRMEPNVRFGQTYRYNTSYFDYVPIKSGDLALVDFANCKNNILRTSERPMHYEDSKVKVSFDPVFIKCNLLSRSFFSYLTPEYEIVRVVAVGGDNMRVTETGEIWRNGRMIAEPIGYERKIFGRTIYNAESSFKETFHALMATKNVTEEDIVNLFENEYSLLIDGIRIEYRIEVNEATIYTPGNKTYVWDCFNCNPSTILYNASVPQGYVMAMFDSLAAPRIMLIRDEDIIGFPFVLARKKS
ncbi:hypothetical protein NDN16_17270 [Aureimonas altamirensis]|uniref:hypothetical protein n=1 Tax=Aureimonas altamirensis TaxID=370622 RepID=UPI00203705AC|nr:hypothetical protein [Aureimonas altamirensis]MCM2505421.1 hypothetical protein [Aureimonas altamirensis]